MLGVSKDLKLNGTIGPTIAVGLVDPELTLLASATVNNLQLQLGDNAFTVDLAIEDASKLATTVAAVA